MNDLLFFFLCVVSYKAIYILDFCCIEFLLGNVSLKETILL